MHQAKFGARHLALTAVSAQLVDDLKVVLAPVPDVHQGVVQRRTIVALEAVDVAKPLGSAVDIGRDDAVEQALKLAVSQMHAVQRFELGSEVGFERGAVCCHHGQFEVAVSESGGQPVELFLTDLAGRLIQKETLPAGFFTGKTWTSEAGPGVYFLKMQVKMQCIIV